MSKRAHLTLLLLIYVSAFLLRFWHYENRYNLEQDHSRDAIVAFESARQFQLPLTGSFSSIGPITFGPWYYWLITLSNFVIPSMWAPWAFITLSSLATVLVMYRVGIALKNAYFGLVLALIAAFSPHQVEAASSLTQHSLVGLLSAIAVYILIRLVHREQNTGISLLWGFVIGVAINVHFQAVGLLALPFFFFILSKNRKFMIPFAAGLIISMTPILLFELNNHWFNTRNIIDYVLVGQYRVWTSNRWLTFAFVFIPSFWSFATGLPSILSIIVLLMAAMYFVIGVLKKKLSKSLIILFLAFLVKLVILRYYRGEKFFGYLQFFHPYVFIFSGLIFYSILERLKKNYRVFIVIAVYIALVLPNTLKVISPDPMNALSTPRLRLLTEYYPGKKFAVYGCKMETVDKYQALTALFYMHKIYDPKGIKITVESPCNYKEGILLQNKIIDVTQYSDEALAKMYLYQLSPDNVYEGMARWWFKEQP